ncbi:MAG: hypothetical protein KKD01_11625 [Proteobacteria bacterium]|nr:hypothetical protein [Pseudomonadota bacterium]MBU1418375.1 hypothetical protein [Pseudomonadota bacterium]MBU1455367.1 hypothetical protein [Pseudomonadota bacterium]
MALQTDWEDWGEWDKQEEREAQENWEDWNTLHSGRKSVCSTGNTPGKDCWKRPLQENDICSFTVCLDCLVYLYQQKTAILSKDEIRDILKTRKGIDNEQYDVPPSSKKPMGMAASRL